MSLTSRQAIPQCQRDRIQKGRSRIQGPLESDRGSIYSREASPAPATGPGAERANDEVVHGIRVLHGNDLLALHACETQLGDCGRCIFHEPRFVGWVRPSAGDDLWPLRGPISVP